MSYGESGEEDDNDVDDLNDDERVNTHANIGEGTSYRPPPRKTLQRQVVPFISTNSEMPSFFNKYFGEETPDSIDVPVGARASYYNPERGELGANMLFKDKNDLIASVKDYSVGFYRREYRVIDSTSILWKIQYRNDSYAARCRWGLHASFKEKTNGFRHCRKIISVDDTHLYTKYKHKMLIAVTLDANNQYVVCGESGVCLISDRHKGIVRAAKDLHYFKPPHGVHRFCLRHVCSNFNARFKDMYLKDLCWEVGKQHQVSKFDETMEVIRNTNILAHRYLAEISKEKWSMTHDGGWHRGVMPTNMSECLNSVLKGAHRLLISAKVHLTLLRCVQYFIERVAKGQRMVHENQVWSDYACRKYEEWARKSSEHRVIKYDVRTQTASVATGGRPSRGQHIQVVRLSTSDCSCGKWTIFGISCSHAICTAKYHSLDPTTLVQSRYNISNYLAAYEGRFEPLADERY
ncbi:uncharacterized protein [Henckelia pumila]|uniref:uncharacterized protein n=1 Tax=Henckelia pumila TaxID=405737 RepID=UPI003C6E3569